jgi:hypothetical protein
MNLEEVMTEQEYMHFVDTVAAAAYATKAAAILTASGLAITRENAAQIYGKWFAEGEHFTALVLAVDAQICDMEADIAELTRHPVGNG